MNGPLTHHFSLKTETKECIPPNGIDPTWVGDGWCDDALNIPDCGYDGGDCCNANSIKQAPYCLDCKCISGRSNVEANIKGN